eukprot:176954-Prorocentrum_minimum.AAC.1
MERAALHIRHTPMGVGARGVTHSSHPDGRWGARRYTFVIPRWALGRAALHIRHPDGHWGARRYTFVTPRWALGRA